MAIKGKRKTRHRTTRTVPGAPRPFYVQPKVPLFQRTGAKFAMVLVAEALVFLLVVLAGAQSAGDRRLDEVAEFTTLVKAQLYQGGAAQESFAGPLVLPELGQAVSQLQSGQVESPQDVVKSAEGWSQSATETAAAVGGIQAEGPELTEARDLMRQGLLLYAELAEEVRVAAELEGPSLKQLAETVGRQMSLAATIFDTGWRKLLAEQQEAGLETEPPSPAGFGGTPGGIPRPAGERAGTVAPWAPFS